MAVDEAPEKSGDSETRISAHAEAQLCHAYAGSRRRPAHHPGVAGARRHRRHNCLPAPVAPPPAGVASTIEGIAVSSPEKKLFQGKATGHLPPRKEVKNDTTPF